jgi:hypothetical protein
MTETKSERLGLRGTLALIESTLRLVGAANATGAITAGAALHAFAQEAALVQDRVKLAGLLFMCGVFAFTGAYAIWFITRVETDVSLRKPEEADEQEKTFFRPDPKLSADEHWKSARKHFGWTVIAGLLSFIFFMAGLGTGVSVAARLYFPS